MKRSVTPLTHHAPVHRQQTRFAAWFLGSIILASMMLVFSQLTQSKAAHEAETVVQVQHQPLP
ncbi:MAG: hypothetical protein AAFR61_15445 [Bacteroidota bacterium]